MRPRRIGPAFVRGARCFALLLNVAAMMKRQSQLTTRQQLQGARLDWAASWSVGQIIKAIQRAAALAPGASCLVQAVTAEALLRRAGFSPEIQIGVQPTTPGRFSAHAWVLLNGHPVLGGSEALLGRYTPLTTLK